MNYRRLILPLIFFLTGGTMMAQDVKSLFDNELNFCKDLNETGYSTAFVKYIADDGIMFIPTPKEGKSYYSKNQNNLKGLFWHAEFGEISADGQFGYTTGPWELKKVSPSGDTTKTYGHFNTVWQKINGEWKFLIDCGVNYAKELIPAKTGSGYTPLAVDKPELKRQRFPFEELIPIDNEFNSITVDASFYEAYKKFASANIRVYRDKIYPVAGLKDAEKLFPKKKSECMHFGGKASMAGDLGFTYGIAGKSAEKPEFNYMRVWKKEGKEWKIVLDVMTAIK